MTRFARAALLTVVAALTASGCGSGDPGRTASGTTASRRLDVAGATRLEVADGFDVRVTLGQPEAATVSYDDNLADLLDVGLDGGTLRVRLKPEARVKNRPTLRAEVTIRRLEAVSAAGASTVDVTGKVQNPGLRLDVSGSSRLTADLGLDKADATVSGSSHLKLTGRGHARGGRVWRQQPRAGRSRP
jgi:putative autotransporter adhesin-like protein